MHYKLTVTKLSRQFMSLIWGLVVVLLLSSPVLAGSRNSCTTFYDSPAVKKEFLDIDIFENSFLKSSDGVYGIFKKSLEKHFQKAKAVLDESNDGHGNLKTKFLKLSPDAKTDMVDGHLIIRRGDDIYVNQLPLRKKALDSPFEAVAPKQEDKGLVLGDGPGKILPTLLASGHTNVLSADLGFDTRILRSKLLDGTEIKKVHEEYLSQHGTHTMAGDLRKLNSLPNGSLNLILVSHLFNELKNSDARHVADECLRLLTVGGRARIATTGIESWSNAVDLLHELYKPRFQMSKF